MNIGTNTVNSRIEYIDFLKFIGLTGIIIAHVGSPSWLMFLRSFDVPLMVVISAFLAEKSYNKYKATNYSVYFFSRFKRLVIPTWIFLLIYFLIESILGIEHSFKYYIASFLCTRYGIGYVWVILIYLYSALTIPFCSRLKFEMLFLVYCMYEIAFHLRLGVNNKFLLTTFYYIIPYGVLTYLGFSFNRMTQNVKKRILLISLVVFLLSGFFYWMVTTVPQLVSIAKYPPRIYYLSYGVFCSFGLLMFCEKYYLCEC